MNKIITVTSSKGGVGKTTFSMMLADIYSKNHRVLLLDLDIFSGSLAFAFGIKPKYSIYDLCEDIDDDIKLDKYIYEYSENISLISAPLDNRVSSKIKTKNITQVLEKLRSKYEVIIIDTSHVINEINMIVYSLSYKIIDIFTNDSYDLQNTKRFISIAKNIDVDNLVLILNNSINPDKKFFSNLEIKNILKKAIDYTIDNTLYLKDYDEIVIGSDLIKFKDLQDREKYKLLSKNMINLLEGDIDEE